MTFLKTKSRMKIHPTRFATPSRKLNSNRGFTLVELLITITIIIVLAALVLTVSRKMKTMAAKAVALSSLTQISAFNMAYSTENNGDINTMRYGGDTKEGGGAVWVQNTFWGRLQPYLFPDAQTTNQSQLLKNIGQRLDKLFNTPDADKMVSTAISGARIYHDTSGLPVPLSFNGYLAPWGKFVKTSSFADPSQIMWAAYGFNMFTEVHGKKYIPKPTDGTAGKCNIYYLDDHKALASFLDGHVEAIEAPIPDRRFK